MDLLLLPLLCSNWYPWKSPWINFPATTSPTCSWINSSSFFRFAPSVAWQPELGCRGDVAGCHGSGRPRCRCPNRHRDPGYGNFPLPLPSPRCWGRLPWKLGSCGVTSLDDELPWRKLELPWLPFPFCL